MTAVDLRWGLLMDFLYNQDVSKKSVSWSIVTHFVSEKESEIINHSNWPCIMFNIIKLASLKIKFNFINMYST